MCDSGWRACIYAHCGYFLRRTFEPPRGDGRRVASWDLKGDASSVSRGQTGPRLFLVGPPGRLADVAARSINYYQWPQIDISASIIYIKTARAPAKWQVLIKHSWVISPDGRARFLRGRVRLLMNLDFMNDGTVLLFNNISFTLHNR